uniref:T-complex protein 1 subunit delta n=1 Tax=Timema cristinae TaxID=61476 RepID=A0A7R9CVK9_TIMCR|nr:unnamed protein product [Timema cristinae]
MAHPSLPYPPPPARHSYQTSAVGCCQCHPDQFGSKRNGQNAVASAIRTSLGPRGMDKMIQASNGEVTITNDGATILNQINVTHPAAKMLVELSKAQDIEAGDGTTSVVVVAGSLLEEAEKLLHRGIHPTIISDAFRLAADKAVEILTEISQPVELTDKESLVKSASTALNSKVVSQHSNMLAPLAVEAVLKVIDPVKDTNVDLKDIKVIRQLGGTVEDTELIDGLVFTHKSAGVNGPRKVEKAKIGLIQFCISPPKTDMDHNVVVSDYAAMDRVLKEERSYILNIIKQIKKSGCNVLLVQKSILRDAVSDLAIHFLDKVKIMVIKDVEREDIEFICKTLSCRPIASLDHFLPDHLASADLVEEVQTGTSKFVKVTGIQNPGRTVTVLVRGSNKLVLEEAARSLHDALCVIRCLVKQRALIAGGGAPETEVCLRLGQYAQTVTGVEAYCLRAFANALEVIPFTLAENAGLNPISTVTELRNKHAQGDINAGINVRKGAITNILEENVVQPLLVSISAITLASETVRSILKIDDIVSLLNDRGNYKLSLEECFRVLVLRLYCNASRTDNTTVKRNLNTNKQEIFKALKTTLVSSSHQLTRAPQVILNRIYYITATKTAFRPLREDPTEDHSARIKKSSYNLVLDGEVDKVGVDQDVVRWAQLRVVLEEQGRRHLGAEIISDSTSLVIPLTMRIVQLRRSRLFKVTVAAFFVVFLLYIIFIQTSGGDDGNVLGSFEKLGGTTPRKRPVLVEGLGNFEPQDVSVGTGPGEGGKPHNMRDDQQNDAAQSQSEYGMNMACSNEISLDRHIPDTRLPECKHWDYPKDLPRVSVIIVFHNEGWSTLMRTVHSVINRSPAQFLEEVLLVDDFSDKDDLKTKLENYITKFDGKVRLVRNKEREGLIRTRSFGAQEARGEVILFLDAHCEVNSNWLPPLLAPIYRDRTIMTVPVIDGIDHKTFEYRPVYQDGHHYRGIFEWGMLYKENEVPAKESKTRKHYSEPYKSPTHAGGLFAIDRKYFLSIGAYDPGLLVWGGENFELSFKIWQCGGSIEWVPCSRVGHVYRGFMPYTFGKLAQKKKGPLITINYKRVIETWFDDKFKEYFYTREPLARFLDMGNITSQLALKQKLHCRSFQWFMDNVAYDVFEKYPELPPNIHWGELRSAANTSSCWDTMGQEAPAFINMFKCLTDGGTQDVGQLRNVASETCLDTMGHGAPTYMGTAHCHGFGNNQLMRLNSKGQLGVGERCIEADSQGLKLVFCRLGTVDGPWQYDETTQTLYHQTHKKCVALHPQTAQLSLMPCDTVNSYQHWVFKEIHPKW